MRNRTAMLLSSGLVLAGLVGTGWAAGYALGDPRTAPMVVPSVSGSATASAAVSAAASVTPTPSASASTTPTPARTAAVARTCSAATEAGDARLAKFQGQVRDARSGEVLFDRSGSKASRAASVMKVLTSAAALQALGADHRLTTRVVTGAEPGEIVLVGGGDVTLSATPAGTATAYPGAPHLATLAAKAKKAWAKAHPGVAITRIVLDAGYFGGPVWQPSWKDKERRLGSTPFITALMVDGDRANPALRTSPRGSDPVGRAGTAFARYFPGATVSTGTAPAGAARLASVRSQPVSTLVQQELLWSDNTIAEALARVTAIESGTGNTFSAIDPAVKAALQRYGVSTAKLRVVDGSGLSDDDRIPPAYLTQLFRQVLQRANGLGPVYDGLPVAGRSGSLSYADRFSGRSARADGHVFAKTGWIDTGYTLAGIVRAKDGTPLTFAFYALGTGNPSAKTALDALAARVYDCGAKLSDR